MVWTKAMRDKALETRIAKKKNGHTPDSAPEKFDWQNAPILEARQAYDTLKKEFEKAGKILNAREMPVPGSYVCWICKKAHLGQPRGTDYSYINPDTRLMEPILICGELCWLRYQEFRINERKQREMPR